MKGGNIFEFYRRDAARDDDSVRDGRPAVPGGDEIVPTVTPVRSGLSGGGKGIRTIGRRHPSRPVLSLLWSEPGQGRA